MRNLIRGGRMWFFDKDSSRVSQRRFLKFEVMLVDDQYICSNCSPRPTNAVTKTGRATASDLLPSSKTRGRSAPQPSKPLQPFRMDDPHPQARISFLWSEFNPNDEQLNAHLLQVPGIAAEHGGESLVQTVATESNPVSISCPRRARTIVDGARTTGRPATQ